MTADRSDASNGNQPDGQAVSDTILAGETSLENAGEASLENAGETSLENLIDGRYQLHEQLGEGGMGSVYRATHVLMDKPVAVKLIHGELAHLTEVVKRFEREARSASRLTDPHCITVTDFGRTEDGTLFLVMELLDGEPLASRLERTGSLPLEKALDVTTQVLKGLAHAHEAGIVHRDLKPENVMLATHGEETDFAKVFDFGIAKIASGAGSAENLTQSGLIVGTPGYLSPEQALGESADHRADLYAMGVMLYEMLAGVRPFTGESAMDVVTAHLTSPIPPLPDADQFPNGVHEIIERAMAKKPAERFDSAAEFLAAIEAIDLNLPRERASNPVAAVVERVGKIAAPASTALSKTITRLKPVAASLRTKYENLPPKQRRLVWALGGACGVALIAMIVVGIASIDWDRPEGEAPIKVVASPELDGKKEDKIKAMFDRADTQIRVGLPAEARVTLKEALKLSPDQPVGHLLLGHALFLTANRGDAMKSYGRALALDKDLAEDVRLVDHLEEGLKWDASRDRAARILAEFGGNGGLELLSTRANSALSDGDERGAARQALIASDKEDRIDWIASLTADFNEYKSCKKRKKIISQMVKTGDPGFLPLLKAHLPRKTKKKKKGLIGEIRSSFRKEKTNSCLESEIKRAIKTLTAIKEGKKKAS